MIPASHLLIGFAVGRLARRAAGDSGRDPRPWRDPLVAAAMCASVFPDWDVLPGIVIGYDAVEFHRGATHSPAGVILQSLLMAPVGLALWEWLRGLAPRLKLAPGPEARLLFFVLIAGMGLHALTDALNPWGIAPLWPLSREGMGWNLVHEGDLTFLAAAALCAAAALAGGARVIAAVLAMALTAPVWWKAERRSEAVAMAERELGGQGLAVYPSPSPDCPWTALARSGDLLRAACVAPSRGWFQVVREVQAPPSPLVDLSRRHPDVENYIEKHVFAYPLVESQSGQGGVVLWRDLRESLLEEQGDPRFGLEVRVDGEGQIVSVEHRWMLKVAF